MHGVTKLTPLSGHISPETAYVVDDYPYGFRLRCKIRYWLEFKSGHGFRLGSQTTNPKVSFEKWNTPKYSTYAPLGVMGLDEQAHVTWTGLSMYDGDGDTFEQFYAVYGASFDVNQASVYLAMLKARDAYRARKAAAQQAVTA